VLDRKVIEAVKVKGIVIFILVKILKSCDFSSRIVVAGTI